MEPSTSIILLTIGVLLILGLLANLMSPKLHIPRVTLLILCGVALGPSGLDLLPEGHERWYTLFSNIALLMIGFILGCRLSRSALEDFGRQVFWISVFEVAGVALGMALVAANHFPDLEDTFIPLIIGTTVFFELTGPLFTRMAVVKAGEAAGAGSGEEAAPRSPAPANGDE